MIEKPSANVTVNAKSKKRFGCIYQSSLPLRIQNQIGEVPMVNGTGATRGTPPDILSIVDDDSEPLLSYQGDWVRVQCVNTCPGGTMHTTNVSGSKVLLSFYGGSIALYGSVLSSDTTGPTLFSWTLDDRDAVQLSVPTITGNQTEAFQVELYKAQELGMGNHTLEVKYRSGAMLQVDYFIYSTTNPGSSSNSSNPSCPAVVNQEVADTASGTQDFDHNRRVIVIATTLVAIVVFQAIALGFLIWLCRRQRRRISEMKVNSKELMLKTEDRPARATRSGNVNGVVPFTALYDIQVSDSSPRTRANVTPIDATRPTSYRHRSSRKAEANLQAQRPPPPYHPI